MDIELLHQRASIIQEVRNFFINQNFLELDTPALSPTLIPETCLEVFSTEYYHPWSSIKEPLYLVPSPEIYIKQVIAQHKESVFQISKCYRNVESVGNTHSPEFTMLEYYKMDADYLDSIKLTEELFLHLHQKFSLPQELQPPFIQMTMNEAFYKYAGFYLEDCPTQKELAQKAIQLGLEENKLNPFSQWTWADLYELCFVQAVEPNLPKDKCVFLLDYPSQVACLAQNKNSKYKQRWELYGRGIELANCYSEETDSKEVKEYFDNEGKEKLLTARVKHEINNDYWKIFSNQKPYTGFPKCSGTAMGIDRLIMLLLNKKTIDSILPFPLK